MNDNEQHILQKHLVKFLLDDVFNTISSDDILKITGPNNWMHKGKKLTSMQIESLRNEAKAFANSHIWRVLRGELLYQAHKKGYVQSTTSADQIAGKMMEYITNVIDTKLKNMSNI